MRQFITKSYRFLHQIIGVKNIAYIIAISYISILNLLTVYGLLLLMEGLFPSVITLLLRLFHFPLILLPTIITFVITMMTAPSMYSISVTQKKRENYLPLIFYTFICILIFAYSMYDKFS